MFRFVMKPAQRFWKWFIENEPALFEFERDRDVTFDRLAAQMRKVHPDLTFEFGPDENGRRDFVVSAAGIKAAFPAVQALAEAAPPLPRWRIIAFRPRRHPINLIEFRGCRVDPSDVEVCLLHDGQLAGLYVFLPGYTDGDSDLGQVAYLLLDEALGEYDIETRVGLIELFPREAAAPGPRIPLADLPQEFDRLMERLANPS